MKQSKGPERVQKQRTHIFEVECNRAQRVCFEHSPKLPSFLFRFSAINFEDELDALHQGHISPVDTIITIAIFWLKKVIEDTFLNGYRSQVTVYRK